MKNIIKKIKEDSRYLFYISIVVVVLLLSLHFAFAQESITPGTCYEDNTTEVCCSNSTEIVQNITLYPGNSNSFEQGNCVVNAACELGNQTSATCVYHDVIEPGDDIDYQTNSCDIAISVDECKEPEDQLCKTELPTTFTKKAHIVSDKSKGEIRIDFLGKKYLYSIDNQTDLDITTTFDYTCPTVFAEDEADADEVLTQCKNIIPVYCTQLSDVLIRRWDVSEGKREDCNSKLDQCQATLSNSVCIESKAYANLIAEKKQLLNFTNDCSEKTGRLELENEDLKLTRGFLYFIIFIMGGVIAFLGIRLKKVTTKPIKL